MRLFNDDYALAKTYWQGTHRSQDPAKTVEDYAALMPRVGITRLANVTGLDIIGIPVYVSIRPNARGLSVCQGKGLDKASAKASALMEAIECWHAENIDSRLRYESYRSLSASETVVDLNDIPTRRGHAVARDRPMLWIEGFDLMQQEQIWVPFEYVNMNWVKPKGWSSPFFSTSNGLASGNHMLEAVSHALCEVVERDASTLWFLDETDPLRKSTQLDLSTVTDETCRRVLDKIAAADLEVAAYDVTSDIGIPTYQCVLFDRPGNPRAMGYFWGFGCHLAPEVALSRALTETVQCRLTEITGTREDIDCEAYEDNRSDDELLEMQHVTSTPPPTLPLDSRTSLATPSFEEDIELIIGRLQSRGLSRAIVVDLSKPDVGVPVVRVIVPGLEEEIDATRETCMPGRRAQRVLEANPS